MVRPERFERPTPWFVAKYSIHLSYGRERGRLYASDALFTIESVAWGCWAGVGLVDLVFFEFVPERTLANLQQARSLGFIAAGLVQRCANHGLFQLVDGGVQFEGGELRCCRGFA